jgi:flagellar hook assembly protein FlgD
VHDMRGRLVTTLLHGRREAGEHSIIWDGTDAGGKNAGSGVYLIGLVSGAEIRSQKVTLMR